MSNTTTANVTGMRLTATGRPTLVGTRKCSECGRPEFHTKKFDTSQNPEDLNERYTLCKGICVYCYAQKRNKKSGTSLTETQLREKIEFYQKLLAEKTPRDSSFDLAEISLTGVR